MRHLWNAGPSFSARWSRILLGLVLPVGVFVASCDHTSRAMLYGRVLLNPGAIPAPSNAPVLVIVNPIYRYFTITNANGEYACPIAEFLGPTGTTRVTIRAFDGEVRTDVQWDKGDMIAKRVNVGVRDTTVNLRLLLGDSIGQQYRPCD